MLWLLVLPLQAEQPTVRNVEFWAEQLDAARFETRQYAKEQLIKAGIASVNVLADRLAVDGVEGSRLGLSVLYELALRRDPRASAEAERVIRELAADRVTGTSYRAAAVLRSVHEMRSSAGVKILRQLGARVRFEHDSVEERALITSIGNSLVFVTLDEGWRGAPNDLFFLEWLNQHRGCKITFQGRRFGDDYLAAIQSNQKIVGLHLKRTGMTDDGMAFTRSMEKLRNVILQHCEMTGACLVHLDRDPSLGLLYVFGGKMPRKDFDAFAKKHEACITRRGLGGFLGIGGDRYENETTGVRGCIVTMVTENHAAERAGIRENDIILRYNGQAVTQFISARPTEGEPEQAPKDTQGKPAPLSLAERIGLNQPGDKVTLTILRDEKEIELNVVLGDWP